MEDIEKESGRIIRTEYAKNRTIAGDKIIFRKGEILYSKLRPYLKKVLVAPADGICTSELVPFQCYGNINSEYITYYLRSPYVTQIVNAASYGVKMPRVNKDTMMGLPVPLPPLAEQKRIVAKIEELLPHVERYGKAHDELAALNEKFPGAMKKSVLQYAMEGKLVEQRAEEGTAKELLKEIRAEKARLVKAGKLKKEKPLPEIKAEEIPFEIPESWMWVRIGDIFNLQAGKNIASSEIKQSQDSQHPYPCYGGNGLRGYVSSFNRNGNYPLIGRQGALCGNINFAADKFYATEHAVVTETYCKTSVQWAGTFLKALNLNQYATATAQPGLAVKTINQVLIPLPPLAEQKRIVTQITYFYTIVDNLKS